MFFDDLLPGFRFSTGSRSLSEAEIIAFARDYDPQVFHTDPDAARDTVYGGLIASGVQTMGVALRLVLEADVWTEASMGSPGFEDLRWTRPVRPGDTLRVEAEVLSSEPSKSRPDRGRTRIAYEVFNQTGEMVMCWTAVQILKREPGAHRT